jgi:hypothetical protein
VLLHTQLFKDRVSVKANLDNYERFINPHEHIWNVKSILELVTQDIDAMCKVLSIALRGFACVWYHNLEHDSILHFHNLSSKTNLSL